jgi:hypothetical protein
VFKEAVVVEGDAGLDLLGGEHAVRVAVEQLDARLLTGRC